jgi:ketosteroid isomerase-like protein
MVGMEQIVRRYLAVLVSGDVAGLADLVAADVVIHGAGTHVRGRHHVERAVRQDGLTCTGIDIHELFTADDRVVVYSTQRLRHDTTGARVSLSALKMYRLADGRIVEFWGETDLYGLMRQLGRVPAEIVF